MLIVWNVQNIMRLRLPLVSSVSLAGKVVEGEHKPIRLTNFPGPDAWFRDKEPIEGVRV